MNRFAAVFMGVSWALVLGVVGWSYYRLFAVRRGDQP
jgi:hypothetical protein